MFSRGMIDPQHYLVKETQSRMMPVLHHFNQHFGELTLGSEQVQRFTPAQSLQVIEAKGALLLRELKLLTILLEKYNFLSRISRMVRRGGK